MDNGSYLIIALVILVIAEIVAICKCGKGWNNNALRLVLFTVVGFLAVITGFFVDIDRALIATYGLLGAIVGHLATRASGTEN